MNEKNSIAIGSVVFVFFKKKNVVIPGILSECINKTNVDGTITIQRIVFADGSVAETNGDIDIFSCLNELKSHLAELMTNSIQRIVDAAEKRVNELVSSQDVHFALRKLAIDNHVTGGETND